MPEPPSRMLRALALVAAVTLTAAAMAHDEAKTPATAPMPMGSPADWFPLSAYPAAARRAEQEGRVVFKLAIDARGVVAGCTIVASSGSEVLDAGTCELARANAHFKPALNGKGVPTMGNWAGAVRWVLEKGEPILAVSFNQVGRLDVSASGARLSCVQVSKGPVPVAAMGDICATFKEPAGLLNLKGPFRDQPARVIIQTMLVMDGDPGFAEEHKLAGRTIFSMARAHFDIATDGQVINCKILEAQAAAGTGELRLCLSPLGPYNPVTGADAIRPRSAMILSSFTIEPLKP